jgi:hypothetical protein
VRAYFKVKAFVIEDFSEMKYLPLAFLRAGRVYLSPELLVAVGALVKVNVPASVLPSLQELGLTIKTTVWALHHGLHLKHA